MINEEALFQEWIEAAGLIYDPDTDTIVPSEGTRLCKNDVLQLIRVASQSVEG